MSIKDTVQSMEQNLKAYYDALEEKGGTVPEERNMENLAGTAGGGTHNVQYTYMSKWTNTEYAVQEPSNIVGSMAYMLASYCYDSRATTAVNFPVFWLSGSASDVHAIQKTNVISLDCDMGYTLPKSYMLGGTSKANGFGVLKTIKLRNIQMVPSNFGTYTSELDSVELRNDDDTRTFYISDNCLNPSGVKNVIMAGKITSIGTNFLHNCDNLQEVYVPSDTPVPSDTSYGALSTTNANAVSYTDGIVLRGPGAAAWKAALPDRTTSPYRKLILAQYLSDLKEALNNGTAETSFPVGTEIYDTTDGTYDPFIVVQYLNDDNNATYGGATGVLLQRKYATDNTIVFNSANNTIFGQSELLSYLNGEYFNKCSSDVKNLASEISVRSFVNGKTYDANTKVFVPSVTEIQASTPSSTMPPSWQYYSDRISTPTAGIDSDRVFKSTTSGAVDVWLRDGVSDTDVYYIYNNGAVTSNSCTVGYHAVPCIFIAKD